MNPEELYSRVMYAMSRIRNLCPISATRSYLNAFQTCTEGSNPSLSAITFVIWHLQVGDTYTDSELNRRYHPCRTRRAKK
jgi:hypothetical protein